MTRAPHKLAMSLAVAALALSGCASVPEGAVSAEPLRCPEGSDCYDPVVPVGPGSSLTLEAGDLFFAQDGVRSNDEELILTAVQGEVEITLENVGQQEHNFRVDAAVGDDKRVDVAKGETNTGALLLFPGEYEYYCDISGHKAGGMVGRLIVLEEPADAEVDPEALEGAAPDQSVPTLEQLDDSDRIAEALDEDGEANVYALSFTSGSAQLEESAGPVLDEIVSILTGEPDLRLTIEGHTDSDGDPEANEQLSQDRAEAVVQALVDRGIDAARLTADGRGSTAPVAPNDTEENKRLNRRVVLKVTT